MKHRALLVLLGWDDYGLQQFDTLGAQLAPDVLSLTAQRQALGKAADLDAVAPSLQQRHGSRAE